MKKNKKDEKRAAPKLVRLLENGVPCLKDMIAPPAFDRSEPDHIKVNNKVVRSFLISGYPTLVHVMWLNSLYNSEDDLDIQIHVVPLDEREALDELTNKITQFQAQLALEMEKGSNRNITRLQSQITDLVNERAKIEQSGTSMFSAQIVLNLYADTVEALNKQAQLMESHLRGLKVKLLPLYLQQDQGYKSALPYGKTWLPRNYRNFSTDALSSLFPFYNAEVSHKNGILVGINTQTNTPIYMDFYDRHLLNNSNITVFGQAGSGKTFLVSLMTMRSVLNNIRTVIIDPEGEYDTITGAMGGSVVTLSPDTTALCPNPFDVECEDEVDEDGKPTGRQIVQIKDKVADLLNLVGVMVGNLTQEQRSLLSYAIASVYEDFGLTEDPRSLYDESSVFENGEFIHSGRKKKMPQISDLLKKLEKITQVETNRCLVSVLNSMRMFAHDGVYGMFDHQTPPELASMKDAPIISFNVKKLDENILRPIGMYAALSWTWEKFAKRNVNIRKRVLVDEAWMMTNKSMAGHEFTATYLENMSRRIRKRNGGLLVASQNFREFSDSPQGQAVLTNASGNIFLKQNSTDIDDVQKIFGLSDGERGFLLSARKGNFLLRASGDSTVGYAYPTPHEKTLIEKGTVAAVDRTEVY